MTPAAHWALRAYPPSFRDRYGDELAALTEDVPPSWRHTISLYSGAARAWLRPAFTGPESTRTRLQASVSTVWVAWCAGFLLTPATVKALLDPPGAGVDATVRRLVALSIVAFAAGLAVVLVGATLLVWQALVPALRARRWSVLRPLLPAVALAVIEFAGLVALVSVSHDVWRPAPIAVAFGSAWLVGLLALLVATGFGPSVTIRRLHPEAAVLRAPTMLAALLALCLAVLTASSAAAVLIAGDARLISSFAPVAAVVAVGVIASSTALVSSARGVLALRHHE